MNLEQAAQYYAQTLISWHSFAEQYRRSGHSIDCRLEEAAKDNMCAAHTELSKLAREHVVTGFNAL